MQHRTVSTALISALVLFTLTACAEYGLAPAPAPTLPPQRALAQAAQAASAEAASAHIDATGTAQAVGAQATATRAAIVAGLEISQTVVALELARVQIAQTAVAITLTQAAAQQTAVVAQGRVVSATTEFFLVGPRLYATQTALAGDMAKRAAGDAQATATGWVCGGLVFIVAAVLIVGALRFGWRLIDAKVDIAVQASEQERAHSREAHAKAWAQEAAADAAWKPSEYVMRVTTPDIEESRRDGWKRNMRIFFSEGEKHGFSNRNLDEDGANVISNENWGRVTQYYKAQGVLSEQKRVTTWGSGWDLARVLDAIDRGTLPYPIGDAVLCQPTANVSTLRRK